MSTEGIRYHHRNLGGVRIIVGKATGQLLYLGVRNKYCSACAQGIPTDKHQRYKNWASSSSEMETDILLEGFRAAESTHGVRYMRMVGDGDSSVYIQLFCWVFHFGVGIYRRSNVQTMPAWSGLEWAGAISPGQLSLQ